MGEIAILHQILIIDFIVKIIFYSNIFGKMGHLLKLIYQCLIDITQFTIIFLLYIFLFSFEYQILGMGMINETEDYPYIDDNLGYFIQTFRNSLGDL
jgi:hypothetical protein